MSPVRSVTYVSGRTLAIAIHLHEDLGVLRLRSGFRQEAPASLTPPKRLKFESYSAHHRCIAKIAKSAKILGRAFLVPTALFPATAWLAPDCQWQFADLS